MRKEHTSHLAFTGLVAGACLMAIALLGVSVPLANAADSNTDPNALPQALEQILKNPDIIPKAEMMFYQNCAYCHGSKGSGGKARPLQCRNMKAQYIFNTISNGRRSGSNIMPPWKDAMGENERWELTAYIMSLKNLPNCEK